MRVIIQRVTRANVTVDGNIIGSINQGFVALVGFTIGDTDKHVNLMVDKIVHLRIFEDELGKMNLSLLQVKGQLLSIPQFTLYADSSSGRRPSFIEAARPEVAIPLYNHFNQALKAYSIDIATGVFGACMQVELINDGPVTIILDSKELFKE